MYQTQYPDIPAFDVHQHFGRQGNDSIWPQLEAYRVEVLKTTGRDIAMGVDLDGGVMRGWVQDPVAGLARIKAKTNGRVLGTLSDAKPLRQLKASSPGDVDKWLERGFCGWKWHCQALFNGGRSAEHGLVNDPYFAPYYRAMESVGMPLLCLHLEAPWGDPKAQRAALRQVMDRHPDLIVVQAHFGMQRWGTLKEHAAVFDAHPNFYRDISTTSNRLALWSEPAEAREFFIKYADRLLFGTDNIVSHKTAEVPVKRWAGVRAFQFEWLETANQLDPTKIWNTQKQADAVPGLNLPRSALEKIYWQNAARIIPHVREGMAALGYSLPTGEIPKPVQPGTLTPRAQRLIEFLPRLKPADIDTLSQEQRSGVSSQLARLGLGGSK